MKEKKKEVVYFNEWQSLNRLWIRLILLFELLFFSAIIYRQLFMNTPFGPWPVTNTGLVVISLLLITPTAVLFFIKIKTTVTDCEIRYKMIPLGLFAYHIKKEKLKSFSINHRKSKTGKQKNGVTLILKNKKELFLPSHNPDALWKSLQKMKGKSF